MTFLKRIRNIWRLGGYDIQKDKEKVDAIIEGKKMATIIPEDKPEIKDVEYEGNPIE